MSRMVEVNVADLIGPALDFAVAKAEGLDVSVASCTPPDCETRYYAYVKSPYKPSRDWSQGGPLIEKYQIDLIWDGVDGRNMWWNAYHQDIAGQQMDQSPLIAACRAIVAAKLGDTVSVPAELLEVST